MCTCSLYFNLFSSLILLFFYLFFIFIVRMLCFSLLFIRPELVFCFRRCSLFLLCVLHDVSCLLFLVLSLELAFHCSSSCSLFLLLLFVLVLCVCDCCCSLFFVRDLAAEASFCFILATAQDFPHPSDQSIIPCYYCSLFLFIVLELVLCLCCCSLNKTRRKQKE